MQELTVINRVFNSHQRLVVVYPTPFGFSYMLGYAFSRVFRSTLQGY
jgi:hypothetical protein